MIMVYGHTLANQKYEHIKQDVANLAQEGVKVVVASIMFKEDLGSQFYAQLKQEQAAKLGIEYQLHIFSLLDATEKVIEKINTLNQDTNVTGIIIQKPWRNTWIKFQSRHTDFGTNSKDQNYADWWQLLYSSVDPSKDVDGLHPVTIEAIKNGSWQAKGMVLPATCQAVLTILAEIPTFIDVEKVIIIGKSDLVGIPLAAVLSQMDKTVDLIGKQELADRMNDGRALLDAQLVVSATGINNLVTGEMVSNEVILVDVGEPKPDIDAQSVANRASFLTPVPGGVGPLTVACLMENAIFLSKKN